MIRAHVDPTPIPDCVCSSTLSKHVSVVWILEARLESPTPVVVEVLLGFCLHVITSCEQTSAEKAFSMAFI